MRSDKCPLTAQARNERNCSIICLHHPPLANPLNAMTIEIPLMGSVCLPFRADTAELAPVDTSMVNWTSFKGHRRTLDIQVRKSSSQ